MKVTTNFDLTSELNQIATQAQEYLSKAGEDIDVTDDYAKFLTDKIMGLAEQYQLNSQDVEVVRNFLKEVKPDYFVLGLNEQDFNRARFRQHLQVLCSRLDNHVVSEQRKRNLEEKSLRLSIVALMVSAISALVSVASYFWPR